MRADDQYSGMPALRAAMTARAQVVEWAHGAELLDLVRTAWRTGWFDDLATATTVDTIARTRGLDVDRVRDAIDVLVEAGVAARQTDSRDSAVALTPEFDAVRVGASGVGLDVLLDGVDAARARVIAAVDPDAAVPAVDPAEAVVVAREWGLQPTEGAGALFAMTYDTVPEYRDRLAADGPLLDVGSGVGGALLTTLLLWPHLRAVGVEPVDAVAEELRHRAVAAEVDERLDVRCGNARDLDDADTYAVCYWAQAFFAEADRASTLTALHRALAPGGLLLVQELVPPPADTPAERSGQALDALVARSRGMARVHTAEELAVELDEAGFTQARIVASPAGRLVLAQRG